MLNRISKRLNLGLEWLILLLVSSFDKEVKDVDHLLLHVTSLIKLDF